MKPATTLLVLGAAAIAAALLLVGCGGQTSISGIAGASIVPASAAAYIAVDSDPDSAQWQQAKALADRFPGQQDGIGEVDEVLRDGAGVSYETDVEPALGPELDLVWLDLTKDGSNFVALMQPDDPELFRGTVAKANAKDPSDKLLVAEVDGWMVISDKQASIDAFTAAVAKDGPVLADDDSFKQAMDDYAAEAIFKAYVNGATVTDSAGSSLSLTKKDKAFVDKVGDLEWLAMAVRTSDEGIRFDTTVRGTPGKLLQSAAGTATPNFELSLPGELPGDVLAYLGFNGVASTLTDLESNPALRDPALKDVKSILRQIGVLLEGEGALYVRPSESDMPEVTLVTQPRKGTDGAARLDSVLGDVDLGGEIDRTQIAGADARKLDLGDGLELIYANVDGKLVVTTAPSGIETIASPPSSSALDSASSFKDALDASGAPDQVQSFFFVDIRGGLSLAERLIGSPVPDEIKDNVKPLKSVVQYAASRPSEVQVTFFIRIDEPVETA